MPIGSGDDDRQRDATPVHKDMAVCSFFSPFSRPAHLKLDDILQRHGMNQTLPVTF